MSAGATTKPMAKAFEDRVIADLNRICGPAVEEFAYMNGTRFFEWQFERADGIVTCCMTTDQETKGRVYRSRKIMCRKRDGEFGKYPSPFGPSGKYNLHIPQDMTPDDAIFAFATHMYQMAGDNDKLRERLGSIIFETHEEAA